VETICGWYRQARAGNANFLLNAGPDKRGLMPEYHRRFLTTATNELGLKI
jgi:alpha-L-fucosidase